MAWLLRDTTVLASVEVAETFRARLRGLLGRRGLDGALLLRPARSVHTIGMRFAIDVAFCDGELRVLHTTTMAPYRLSRPVRRACVVIEAERGAFERWGLAVGDQLAVHGESSSATGQGLPGEDRRCEGSGPSGGSGDESPTGLRAGSRSARSSTWRQWHGPRVRRRRRGDSAHAVASSGSVRPVPERAPVPA